MVKAMLRTQPDARCPKQWRARLALCVCLLYTMAVPAGAQSAPMSVQQYRQELLTWQSRVPLLRAHPEQAAAIEQLVPREWQVQQGHRILHIPGDWLQVEMARIVDDHSHNPAEFALLSQAIQDHLAQLDPAAGSSASAVRAQLRHVLARREFRNVHPPGAMERARNRFWEWLNQLLSGAIDHADAHPTTLQWVIWAVILLAMAISLRLVWHYARNRRRPLAENPLPPGAPSATPWQTWIERARTAAGNRQFRDAVHGTYWAAISWLEEQGAWIPDHARTPREYLRLVKQQTHRSRALLALTRRFEPVWYGGHAATADDFDAMLRELEELGCR